MICMYIYTSHVNIYACIYIYIYIYICTCLSIDRVSMYQHARTHVHRWCLYYEYMHTTYMCICLFIHAKTYIYVYMYIYTEMRNRGFDVCVHRLAYGKRHSLRGSDQQQTARYNFAHLPFVLTASACIRMDMWVPREVAHVYRLLRSPFCSHLKVWLLERRTWIARPSSATSMSAGHTRLFICVCCLHFSPFLFRKGVRSACLHVSVSDSWITSTRRQRALFQTLQTRSRGSGGRVPKPSAARQSSQAAVVAENNPVASTQLDTNIDFRQDARQQSCVSFNYHRTHTEFYFFPFEHLVPRVCPVVCRRPQNIFFAYRRATASDFIFYRT